MRFEVQDVLHADLSQASVVTLYLVPLLVQRLEPRLLHALRPGARVVSHAFAFPSWPYDEAETVRLERPHPTQGDTSRIFLYVVPAQARGAWRAPGGWRLRVQQNFQAIEVEALHHDRPRAVRSARLRGEDMVFSGDGFAFRGRVTREGIVGEMLEASVRTALAFERAP